VLIGPVIPGLSDRPDQVEAVVDACVDAGATSVSAVALHLRRDVREHYLGWLSGARPDLLALYERRYRGGANLPKPDRDALADLVRARMRARAGPEARSDPVLAAGSTPPPRSELEAPQKVESAQLTFGL
jgi:DNA repair photolyase